ncbi:MAG TPA: hypothetical protein GX515_10120 [Firmicutes bacterium]|nr:hypothetical protein [Bacillota bacterium]
MTPEAVLDRLRSLGARVSLVGDKLRVEAPAGVLRPELKAALIGRKTELVRLLRPAPDLPPPVCDRCGGTLFWQSIAYGPWTCARCCPPDTGRIVARWSSQEAGRAFEEVHCVCDAN